MPDARYTNQVSSGIDTLLRVTDMINRTRTQRRQLDLQEKMHQLQVDQAKDDNSAASINARANFINALTESGFISKVKLDELQKTLSFVGEFTSQSKQARKAEAQKEVVELKQTGRTALQTQKNVAKAALAQTKIIGKTALQTQKEVAKTKTTEFVESQKNIRQQLSLAQISALNGLTPAEMIAGLQAVQEADPTKANSLRANEDFIVVPGEVFFVGKVPLFEVGGMTITNNDIIDKIGTENFTDDCRNALKYFGKAMVDAASQEEKDQQKKMLLEAFPILGRLFEGE